MAMAGVTEEKKEGEEERKSEESNNSDNLVGFISHATDDRASDWPGGRGVSRPRSPAAGCRRDDIEDKDAAVEGGEVGEHRDARLPSRYVSRSRGLAS